MTTTIVLTIVAIIALLLAGTGIIIPGLPGIPALWVLVALDFLLLGFLDMSGMTFFWLTFLALVTIGIDYLATSLGVKKRGGSVPGMIGSVVGLILGLAVFQVPGMLIGCFLGALVGELIHGREVQQASYIAVGALIGYATSAMVNLGIWAVYAVVIFWHIYK